MKFAWMVTLHGLCKLGMMTSSSEVVGLAMVGSDKDKNLFESSLRCSLRSLTVKLDCAQCAIQIQNKSTAKAQLEKKYNFIGKKWEPNPHPPPVVLCLFLSNSTRDNCNFSIELS